MKLKTADGQEVELYGDDAKAALLAGAAPTKTDSSRQWGVTDADGKTWIAKSHLDAINNARQTGQKLWIPEDDTRDQIQQDSMSELKTFGKETASAVTFGLTDFARDPEIARIEREENPISAGAGQVVGSIAPALFTGGVTGIAKAGRLGVKAAGAMAALEGGASTAAKIGGAAAVGAIEGAAQSAKTTLTRAISPLDDVDLTDTGVSIAANIVGGALLGGIMKGFGQMMPKSDKLYGDVLAQTNKAKNSKIAGGDLIEQKEINRLAVSLKDEGILTADPRKTLEAINGKLGQLGDEAKTTVEKLQANVTEMPADSFASFSKNYTDSVASIQQSIAKKARLGMPDDEALALSKNIAELDLKVKKVLEPIIGVERVAVKDSADLYQNVRELRQNLDQRLGDVSFKTANPSAVRKTLKEYRNVLSGMEKDSIQIMRKALPDEQGVIILENLNKRMSDLMTAKGLTSKSIVSEASSGITSSGFAITTAVSGNPLVGLFQTIGNTMMTRGAKAYGSTVKLQIAELMSHNEKIPQFIKMLALKGPSSISDAVVRSSKDVQDLSVPEVHNAAFYKDHLEKINEMGRADQNPEYQKMLQNFENVKTGISAQVAQKANVMAGFLNEKAPKMTFTSGLNPRAIMPSKTSLDKYSQYLRAVTDPTSIFMTIAQGKQLTAMQQEVMDRVYPEYKKYLVDGLSESMADPLKIINPSAAKAGLGLGGSFSEGKSIALLQGTFVQKEAAPVSKPMTTELKDRNTVKFGLQS